MIHDPSGLLHCLLIDSVRHGRLLADCGLAVECRDAAPGPLCWYPVRQQAVGRCGAVVFLSWPPRSAAALESLQEVELLILVADRGAWHGGEAFHQALEAFEPLFQHRIACWPHLHDDLRVLRNRGPGNKRGLKAEAFEALPALSAAAAAAAFDAVSPDLLQNLLQEQHREQLPAEAPKVSALPLVISVAEALAPEPKDLRTTVMLRNLPNNYTPRR